AAAEVGVPRIAAIGIGAPRDRPQPQSDHARDEPRWQRAVTWTSRSGRHAEGCRGSAGSFPGIAARERTLMEAGSCRYCSLISAPEEDGLRLGVTAGWRLVLEIGCRLRRWNSSPARSSAIRRSW